MKENKNRNKNILMSQINLNKFYILLDFEHFLFVLRKET